MDAKLVRWADRLAWVAAGMAGVAALAGLATGVYRDDALMVAQARGQDIVTLFGAVPILAVGLALARRGSFACRVVAVGALGPRPRVLTLERYVGSPLDEHLAQALGQMVYDRARPLPNIPYDAEYRRERMVIEVRRAVRVLAGLSERPSS